MNKRANEKLLVEGTQTQINKLNDLEAENSTKQGTINQLKKEIKRYQDSMNYLNRQVDQDKL
jgi:uncharacterized protein YlxW (UPF0749 family)